jgi:Ca2+-binding RTX toxin-like protein
MKKNKINPGPVALLAMTIASLTACFLIFDWPEQHQKTQENKTGPGNIHKSALIHSLSGQSLRFIANRGQIGSEALFHVQAAGHTVLLWEDKITLRRIESSGKWNEITVQFYGANRTPEITGAGKLPGVAHFFRGSDPENWQTNVPTYSSVFYRELYPGINMAYIGDDGILESEFYVSPGADYHHIRLNYNGITSKHISEDGNIVLETSLGELVEKAPIAYQDVDGIRKDVKVVYTMLPDGNIGFSLGDFRNDLTVVIDPELIFLRSISTAGAGVLANGVVIDQNGDLILAGDADRFFEVTDSIDGSAHYNGSSDDCLLLKLDGTTGEVIYSALLGGTESDFFNDVAIGPEGNLYLTGQSSSSDFPVLNANQESLAGMNDAFYVILDTMGQITYSTFLGGSGRDWGSRIVLDGMGNTFITGGTGSSDFPVVNPYQQQNNGGATQGSDIFIVKLNASGNVVFATYLGGSEDETVKGLTVNGAGEVTITGYTKSTDYPTANAYQENFAGGIYDMVYTRLNSTGNGLVFSSYFGGSGSDRSGDMKQGPSGDFFVAGQTQSDDFPVMGGASNPEEGGWDGVVMRFDSSGHPLYSLRTNVSGFDSFTALAVDDSNTAYLVGTWSDTLWIYQKPENDSLDILYDTLASGHNIFDVCLAGDYLAFTGTYWGAKKSDAASEGANVTAGKMIIKDKFKIEFTDEKKLIINLLGKKSRMVLDVNEDGFITVNGVPTSVKAWDVDKLSVYGTEGDDEIDLSHLDRNSFRSSMYTGSILAFGGDDIIKTGNFEMDVDGGEGDDIITGGNSGNYIDGGPGDDDIYGGDGPDHLIGGAGNDKIFGGKGDDLCEGKGGNDLILGEDGNDTCLGGRGNDDIDGGDGEDEINGNAPGLPGEKDVMKGKSGDDVIESGLKALKIITGKGNDKVKVLPTPSDIQDKSLASVPDTVLIQDEGGIDTLDFSEYGTAVSMNLSISDSVQIIDTSSIQVMLSGNFEVFLATNFNDSISVSPLPDTSRFIDGGNGTDVLNYLTVDTGFSDNGYAITAEGFAEVAYMNIETVNLPFKATGMNPTSTVDSPFGLDENYPNPFTSVTTIRYKLMEASDVNLSIYTSTGQLVATLVDAFQPAGEHMVQWDGRNDRGQELSAGVYLYLMETKGKVYTRKMLLQR